MSPPTVTDDHWATFTSALQETAQEIVFKNPKIDSDLARAEGLRYLTRLIAGGSLVELEAHDPAYPHFVRILNPWIQWGLPNPDCGYLHAAVHGDYSYRISGRRGSARVFRAEVYEGDWARMAGLHVFDGSSDLVAGPQGEFELVLSREERPGNWLRLPPGAGFLFVRQIYSDWDREEPAQLLIEREGAEYPPPAPTPADLVERLQLLTDFVRHSSVILGKGVEQYYTADPDRIPFPPIKMGREDEYTHDGMHFGQGYYQCEPDQAVILEVEPPPCDYWGIQLVSQFWESMDWYVSQTSLNNHQGVLDSDGCFRAVISHRDPGVPNWLDTRDHTIGLISARYYRPESVPVPGLRTVPFDKVRELLPPETPEVTPAERRDMLRRRMLSVRRRMCD